MHLTSAAFLRKRRGSYQTWGCIRTTFSFFQSCSATCGSGNGGYLGRSRRFLLLGVLDAPGFCFLDTPVLCLLGHAGVQVRRQVSAVLLLLGHTSTRSAWTRTRASETWWCASELSSRFAALPAWTRRRASEARGVQVSAVLCFLDAPVHSLLGHARVQVRLGGVQVSLATGSPGVQSLSEWKLGRPRRKWLALQLLARSRLCGVLGVGEAHDRHSSTGAGRVRAPPGSEHANDSLLCFGCAPFLAVLPGLCACACVSACVNVGVNLCANWCMNGVGVNVCV